MFNHILLEVYCTKCRDENIEKKSPEFCNSEEYIPQYSCLLNNCPFACFTSHENALCYINNKSEAKKIISIGEQTDNCEKLWEKISCQKIDEAYELFTDAKNKSV